MNKRMLVLVAGASALFAACNKENDTNNVTVKPYTVPTTYSFSNANYTTSSQRVKMVVALDSYLKTANAGTAVITLDQAMVDNMFNNTNNPFSDATLNTSGINMKDLMADNNLYKAYADSVVMFNTGANASAGTGGFVPRGANKIIVGPRGVEYGQAYVKGVMGALLYKEAVRLLNSVKTMSATDTVNAQKAWDEAFGYLAVPTDYDTTKTYTSADPDRPLLWGGYLAERGKAIQAGGIMFAAFLKGRAAIGGYDMTVRNQQADIIIAKWEQLAAAAALNYVTSPTSSSAIGNLGSQFHALSEGLGFMAAFKYRPATSPLSQTDLNTLNSIINKDFYDLINQPGFTDLVTAQNILKATYGL